MKSSFCGTFGFSRISQASPARCWSGWTACLCSCAITAGQCNCGCRDRVAPSCLDDRIHECIGSCGHRWHMGDPEGILLMVLYSHYLFHTSVIVGLALAMTTANGWSRVPMWRPWLRLALFVMISAALYYVTGGAYYCFVACCVVYEVWLKNGGCQGCSPTGRRRCEVRSHCRSCLPQPSLSVFSGTVS